MKKVSFLLKNILFRSSVVKIGRQVRLNSKLTKDELNKLTLGKLKKLFSYAKENVPYYKHAFRDINVEDIKSLDDWEKIPILTKQDIRDNMDNLTACNISAKRLIKVTTGGSTGAPLTVYQDKKFPVEVIAWRVLNWWGIKPYSNIAFIYRLFRKGWKSILNNLMWYPTKRLFLDASLMTTDKMEAFYNDVMALKPEMIQGYVGGVFEFAKFCQKNNFELNFLKAVWVTSAPLPEPNRKFMEKAFNAPVYDQYGCCEVFWLAAECRKKEGLHVFSDLRHIEILAADNRQVPIGDYGEVTITDLENFAFPIIRYKNGDKGRYLKKSCSCGLPFPLIDKIRGRVSDIVRLQSGKVVTGEYLTTIFDDFPDAIKEFQLYQYKDYSICLFCVLGTNDNAMDICNMKAKNLRELISNEVNVDLRIVDNIKHDRGKTRFIISEID
jgi:phenylacetate-coenzyme A ligase PaaK-like adenylate-forming protein